MNQATSTSVVCAEPAGGVQDKPAPKPAPARQPKHPTIALLAHYRAIFGAAWAHRTELAGPSRMANEVAFLPAALSLQETPVHPAPRRLAFLIMALFVLALVWSIFGQVDIVAVAPGRIIVSDRTKVIQPLEAGVVKAILVRDGDRVQAGQVLIELDPTIATADKASVQEQLSSAISEELRTAALLKAMHSGELPSLGKAQADPATQAQLQSEWQDIAAKQGKLDAEATHRQAEIATVQETIAKLEATIPMAQTREQDFKKLVEQGYISGHATQDKTRERVELERDLATQRARLVEAYAAFQERAQTQAAFQVESMRNLNDRNAQAVPKRQQFRPAHVQERHRDRLTHIASPVS